MVTHFLRCVTYELEVTALLPIRFLISLQIPISSSSLIDNGAGVKPSPFVRTLQVSKMHSSVGLARGQSLTNIFETESWPPGFMLQPGKEQGCLISADTLLVHWAFQYLLWSEWVELGQLNLVSWMSRLPFLEHLRECVAIHPHIIFFNFYWGFLLSIFIVRRLVFHGKPEIFAVYGGDSGKTVHTPSFSFS